MEFEIHTFFKSNKSRNERPRVVSDDAGSLPPTYIDNQIQIHTYLFKDFRFYDL